MYWKDKSRWKSPCLCNNYITSGIYWQFHTCCTHIRKPYVCAILPWWGNLLTVIQWNFMWQCWTVLTMLPNSEVENPSCPMKRSMISIGQLLLCLCNNGSRPILPKVYFTTEVGASKIQKLKLVSWNLLGGRKHYAYWRAPLTQEKLPHSVWVGNETFSISQGFISCGRDTLYI